MEVLCFVSPALWRSKLLEWQLLSNRDQPSKQPVDGWSLFTAYGFCFWRGGHTLLQPHQCGDDETKDAMFVLFHWPVSPTVPVSVSVRWAPSHFRAEKQAFNVERPCFATLVFLFRVVYAAGLLRRERSPKDKGGQKQTAPVNWAAHVGNEALKFHLISVNNCFVRQVVKRRRRTLSIPLQNPVPAFFFCVTSSAANSTYVCWVRNSATRKYSLSA